MKLIITSLILEIGDEYELMLWGNGWESGGKQIARSNKLLYKNMPSNGLYWLKNTTKGKEELPFFLSKDGIQFWPGQ